MSHAKKHSRSAKQTSSRNLKLWGGLAALAVLVIVIGVIVAKQAANSTSATGSVGNDANTVPLTMTPGEAAVKRDSGAFILDVRTKAEWMDVHIPNSILIPLDELPKRLNELPRDKVIIVVCRSGSRSAQGRDILRDAGFVQVTSLAGGVTQWRAEGYPTASGQV